MTRPDAAPAPALTGSTPRRPTRQRAAIDAALTGCDEFRSAQEIHAVLAANDTRVGLATVYRNLQAMAAEGEIDVLRTDEGEALYRACRTETHHHHLVCRECGRTVEVEGPPAFEAWSEKVSAAHGYRDVTHTLEIFGICSAH